jgi:hypothetical protein
MKHGGRGEGRRCQCWLRREERLPSSVLRTRKDEEDDKEEDKDGRGRRRKGGKRAGSHEVRGLSVWRYLGALRGG